MAPPRREAPDARRVVAHVVRENGKDWGPDDLGPKNAGTIALHR